MKILILGSSGILGQAVVKQLAPLPDVDLRVFDRGKKGVTYPDFVEHIVGDATSVADLKDALNGVDVVFSTLGPFKVETFATPLVQAMQEAGVSRLFWSTQFQIYDDGISPENLKLAASFGFDEATERGYVENQRQAADIIEATHLDSTLLMIHFFNYDQSIQHAVLDAKDQPVSGGPISIASLAIVLAEMLHHEADYRQDAIKISAKD
ncbi:NAD(P)H-binding protein [Secundilactobacillus silagei]|uniref:Short-chain dehydrogenase/oxidoreductase n=1 Tax=Secundilactobacillus silagei JCM 19001 TaxID=1302250 RepID=A0A1Z5H3V5_9LACO|nr:NAD(P)H-binding protein [Secundilactobacillus silagei]TDG70261.1 hypothetical protein C5L25_001451 [Secundilactobacillus silagei JCM 19001]GAT17967.1 short-chain dehydrogenase/oxidoreductase [Secundilactobacillus silagei JCM 19001]